MPVPVGCKLTLKFAGFNRTSALAIKVEPAVIVPVLLIFPPTYKFFPTPTPPVTTTAPLELDVLCVVSVNVVKPLLVNVVNAPGARVVLPIDTLSIVLCVVGLIVTVPLGLKVALVVAVNVVKRPVLAVVAPILILSMLPKLLGAIVTLPVPVGWKLIEALVPLNVTFDFDVNVPVISVFAPTYKFLAIPIPPAVTIAPVVVDTLFVVLSTFNKLLICVRVGLIVACVIPLATKYSVLSPAPGYASAPIYVLPFTLLTPPKLLQLPLLNPSNLLISVL